MRRVPRLAAARPAEAGTGRWRPSPRSGGAGALVRSDRRRGPCGHPGAVMDWSLPGWVPVNERPQPSHPGCNVAAAAAARSACPAPTPDSPVSVEIVSAGEFATTWEMVEGRGQTGPLSLPLLVGIIHHPDGTILVDSGLGKTTRAGTWPRVPFDAFEGPGAGVPGLAPLPPRPARPEPRSVARSGREPPRWSLPRPSSPATCGPAPWTRGRMNALPEGAPRRRSPARRAGRSRYPNSARHCRLRATSAT